MEKSQLRKGNKYRIIGNGNPENGKVHHGFPIGTIVTLYADVFEGRDDTGQLITQYVDRDHIAPLLKLELI